MNVIHQPVVNRQVEAEISVLLSVVNDALRVIYVLMPLKKDLNPAAVHSSIKSFYIPLPTDRGRYNLPQHHLEQHRPPILFNVRLNRLAYVRSNVWSVGPQGFSSPQVIAINPIRVIHRSAIHNIDASILTLTNQA